MGRAKDSTEVERLRLLKAKVPVEIYFATDLSVKGCWAVSTPDGFWLDAFPTRKLALEFVRKHKLPLSPDQVTL